MSWIECPKCGVLYRGEHKCPKATATQSDLPQITYGGANYWRNTPSAWLPLEALDVFFNRWFYPKWMPEDLFNIKLSALGIEEVRGTVHLPAEHLGPIEKQGRYSKIYKLRPNIYFVPVYFEYDTEKYVNFVHLKVGAVEPFVKYGEKLMARERSQADAESAAKTFQSAGYTCRVIPEIDINTRHPTGMWEVWCEKDIFEKLPPHAKRVYSLSAVLPEPRYNIAVNGTWIGEHKKLEDYPWLGNVFFPTNWKTKQEAIEQAKAIIAGKSPLPSYMGSVDMAKAVVEVVECFGSYPEDRATVWKNGEETYMYKA